MNAVREYKTDFLLTPVQFTIPRTINFSAQDSVNVNAQISKFLQKWIIVKSSLEEAEFVSNIFWRPKKDGSFRIILNLKDVNTFVSSFKMDSIHTCSQLMRPCCYMASITYGIPTIQCLLPKSTKNILHSYSRETCINLAAWLRGSSPPSLHQTYVAYV